MAIHDLHCPDGKFVTELDGKLFAGGRHDDESGNAAVCGAQVRQLPLVGPSWSQLDVSSTADGSPPHASALRNRNLAKRRPTGRGLIVIVRHVERLRG